VDFGLDLVAEHFRDEVGWGVGGFGGDAVGEGVDAVEEGFEGGGGGGFSFVVGACVELGEECGEVGGEGFVANRAAELEGVAEAGFGEAAGRAG
jgi:hypothetical protein